MSGEGDVIIPEEIAQPSVKLETTTDASVNTTTSALNADKKTGSWLSRGGMLARGILAGTVMIGGGLFAKDRIGPNTTPAASADTPAVMEPAPSFATAEQPRIETIISELPNNILTPEQLEKNHIRIVNYTDTKLYLTENALNDPNNPLFRDVSQGKTGEAVIVLMDSPSISWAATEKIQDPELKRVLQAVTVNPAEVDNYTFEWPSRINAVKEHIDEIKKLKDRELQTIESIKDGTIAEAIQKEITTLRSTIETSTRPDQKATLTREVGRLEQQLSELSDGTGIERAQRHIEVFDANQKEEEDLLSLLNDPQRRIAREQEIPQSYGNYIRPKDIKPADAGDKKYKPEVAALDKRREALVEGGGAELDKNYIFIPLTGEMKPTPDQTVKADQFVERDFAEAKYPADAIPYQRKYKIPSASPYILDQILTLYGTPSSIDLAGKSSQEAFDMAKKYDPSKPNTYTFIFENDEGITGA